MMFQQLFDWVGNTHRHNAGLAIVLAAMSIQGVSNLRAQWAISGQYMNIPTEQLFEWINRTTDTS
jgi:fido (protein-threonine AMPylation protein)